MNREAVRRAAAYEEARDEYVRCASINVDEETAAELWERLPADRKAVLVYLARIEGNTRPDFQ